MLMCNDEMECMYRCYMRARQEKPENPDLSKVRFKITIEATRG